MPVVTTIQKKGDAYMRDYYELSSSELMDIDGGGETKTKTTTFSFGIEATGKDENGNQVTVNTGYESKTVTTTNNESGNESSTPSHSC